MRIGIDATPIFLPQGGIGYYTYYILQALIRIDSSNEYCLFNTSPKQKEPILTFPERPNVRIIETSKIFQKWRCRKEHIEIYHGTNFRLRGWGIYGHVVTIHDLAFKYYPHFLKKNYGQFLSFLKTRRDAHLADRIIAVSHNTAKDIVKFFKVDPQKIKVVYHGVEERFRPDVPQKIIEKIKKKYRILTPKYMLWVGTIEPRKNITSLVKMYQQLEALHKNWSLVLGGQFGWKYEEVLPLIESCRDKVLVTGYLPREDLVSLYAGADLFIYPSLYEGFGMPLLEAMASGVPIVAANTSSIPEVVGEAGILVDPLDIAQLAEAVLKIIEDEALRISMREKSIQRAKKFTWEQTAVETLEIYKEIYNDRKA